ncbi:MAG: hypothetical protein JXB08_03700 [Bacilli bacterium]|nr:hypothetical protein [Bacilli bacterium]MBN2876281.1 hypothetical protein [Bacilli bacterium]
MSMQNVKYKETFTIKTYEADFLQRAKPITILAYMQEVATNHASRLGFGYEDSYQNGFIWILRNSKYEFDRIPKLDEQLEVYTWPVGLDGLKALRRFEFKINGELVGHGYTHWLMLDLLKNKPIISEYFIRKMEALYMDQNDIFQLRKVPACSQGKRRKEIMIDHTFLDWNMHVNNIMYADLISSALTFEEVEQYDITSLQIEYLKECRQKDVLELYVESRKNHLIIEGRKDSEAMFRALLELKVR